MTTDKSIYEGLPKKERQALTRELARMQREEMQRKQKRRRIIVRSSLIVGGVAVLAIIGLVTYNAIRATYVGPLNMLSDGVLLTGDATAKTVTAKTTVAIQPGASPVANTHDKTSDVVSVVEYVDYGSADVSTFETTNKESLQGWLSSAYITYEIHPVALLDAKNGGYSTRAANAVACVANTTPDAVLAVHNSLVAAQPDLKKAGLSTTDIIDLLSKAGVTDPAITDCVKSNGFTDWVTDATNRVQKTVPNSDVSPLKKAPLVVANGIGYTGALDDNTAFTTWIADTFDKTKPADTSTDGSTDGSGG